MGRFVRAALPVVIAFVALAVAAPAEAGLWFTGSDGKTPWPVGSEFRFAAPAGWAHPVFAFQWWTDEAGGWQEIDCAHSLSNGWLTGKLESNGQATDTISITTQTRPYAKCEDIWGTEVRGEGAAVGTNLPWTLKITASGHATVTPAQFELTDYQGGHETWPAKSMIGFLPVSKTPRQAYLGFALQPFEGPGLGGWMYLDVNLYIGDGVKVHN